MEIVTGEQKRVSQTLQMEEGKELLGLCRAGRLYEVEAWIAAGRSLQVLAEFKKTPLQISVGLGFHSLVELLIIHETCQTVKNGALAKAVELRSVELVQLLLQHGAEITGVHFSDVLRTWEPNLIRLFLESGADVVTGLPFAIAFGEKVRTALRPFVDYKTAHPELSKELQDQADRALRHFCREGDLKWVSLLLWAGSDPRTMGPKLYDPDDQDLFVTALQEACGSNQLAVLRRLKPNPKLDDLSDLLRWAAIGAHGEIIRYLLEIGAMPNNKANGGSTALDTCLWHISIEGVRPWHTARSITKFAARGSLEAIQLLTEHGAIWRPDDRTQMNSVRRILLGCEPEVTIELLKILVINEACSGETLRELFSSPRMRQHLSKEKWWLSRLKLQEIAADPPKRKIQAQIPTVSRELLSRYNREELYEKAWSQPMQKLAKGYGVSDVGLAKVCKKLYIPVPGRGYWAKKAARRPVAKRPSLKPISAL
jgi:hypothetical protein